MRRPGSLSMPLREDLLEPIDGENPSGLDLRYDKVFDQIKEARTEEDDSIPSGAWGRSAKKADRVLVLKLAGEMLAKRSKDLRVAGWYLESLVRKEGFAQLPKGLDFLWKLEDQFWETVHPVLDEDGNADLRVGAIESAANLLALSMKQIGLTRTGVNWAEYQDARAIGFETEEMSTDKATARREAIEAGKMTGEDLQRSIDGTPKAFYVETEGLLVESLELLSGLDEFQQEKYGDDYPSMSRLKSAIEDVKKIVSSVLTEKRKTEPDAGEEPEAEEEERDAFSRYDEAGAEEEEVEEDAPVRKASKRKSAPVGVPTDEASAYEQIAAAAEFLRTLNSASPVPYLLCSALRLGETRGADLSDSSFPVAPPTETRQALRRLANEGNWDELAQLCLKTMTEPCGRVWLDLQRYAWRAASESWNANQAKAIAGTVRALLTDYPEIRGMTMDDDTPAANAETLQWIDAEILPPVPEAVQEVREEREEPAYEPPVYVAETQAAEAPPDIYETALAVLKRGRVAEAINMLVRDSEQQPSGRMRFHRRVQMAQLCLAADQGAVAYPVLRDLSSEMERRSLETWESGEMLAQPLSLLLRCLEQRKGNDEEREVIFERLCRLDPQAALTVRR
jgi:type VI secretion system protein ImpA